MSRTIHVEVAHTLGSERAMQRIRGRAEKLQKKHGVRLQSVEAKWGASTAEISVRALGQTIPARVEVTDTLAKLSIALPLLATPFSGPIEAYLGKEAQKILTGQP